jgi:hypothetical protein
MRVCQFRHFGTGIASGINQIGSKFESRKMDPKCQGTARPIEVRRILKISRKSVDGCICKY